MSQISYTAEVKETATLKTEDNRLKPSVIIRSEIKNLTSTHSQRTLVIRVRLLR